MLIVYMRDNEPFDAILIASSLSMNAAKKRREVAGDLIFNEDLTINQSDEWLFDWEKKNENCYARKCQKANRKITDKLCLVG